MLRMYSGIKGLSLVELIISLAMGVAIVLSAVWLFTVSLKHHKDSFNLACFYQELHFISQLMANDIKRAGYWANAGRVEVENIFMANANDLYINNAGNCILFSYDKDNDGILPAINSEDDERYGYRLNNYKIQVRTSAAQFSCDSQEGWQDITDSKLLKITKLEFVENAHVIPANNIATTVKLRDVTITISGELAANPNIGKTITRNIKLRNDKLVNS